MPAVQSAAGRGSAGSNIQERACQTSARAALESRSRTPRHRAAQQLSATSSQPGLQREAAACPQFSWTLHTAPYPGPGAESRQPSVLTAPLPRSSPATREPAPARNYTCALSNTALCQSAPAPATEAGCRAPAERLRDRRSVVAVSGTHHRQERQPRALVQAVWCSRALLTASHKADKPQEPRSGARQASWERTEPDLPAGREAAASSPPAAAGEDTQPIAQLHGDGALSNPVQATSLGRAKPPGATQ